MNWFEVGFDRLRTLYQFSMKIYVTWLKYLHIVGLFSNALCKMLQWGISKCNFCINTFHTYPCILCSVSVKTYICSKHLHNHPRDFCKLLTRIVFFSRYWIFISKCCNFVVVFFLQFCTYDLFHFPFHEKGNNSLLLNWLLV